MTLQSVMFSSVSLGTWPYVVGTQADLIQVSKSPLNSVTAAQLQNTQF